MILKNYLISTFLILNLSCVTQVKHIDHSRVDRLQKKWSEDLSVDEVDYFTKSIRMPSAVSKYNIIGNCDGLPKVDVKTAPGFCLGLVDNGEDLIMPRMLTQVSKNEFILIDMGGWVAQNSSIYILTREGNSFQRKLLLSAKNLKNSLNKKLLDRAHTVLMGPDNLVYIGNATNISKFNWKAKDLEKSLSVVISDLSGDGLHPLKNFIFHPQSKNIILNVGASTNVCQKQGIQGTNKSHCQEAESVINGEAEIREYPLLSNGAYSLKYKILAKGLRNSMGLAWDSNKNRLIQVENSRDAINKFNSQLSDEFSPSEELNIIREGQHYGWPYCYDNSLNSPEWTHVDCTKYQEASILLPPHSAPLGLIQYKGKAFPDFYKGKFLISLHGYRAFGHRIITYDMNNDGELIGEPLSLVYDWDKRNEQLMGSPVAITEAFDGSVYIVEDKSKKILRLYFDNSSGSGVPVNELNEEMQKIKLNLSKNSTDDLENQKNLLNEKLRSQNPPIFSQLQFKLFDKYCVSCHGGEASPGIQFKQYADIENAKRIIQMEKATEIFNRVSGKKGFPQMPPQGIDDKNELEQIKKIILDWINQGLPVPE